MLHWYDRQARIMPWRTSPMAREQGQRPDPYRVWLSEVMLQQTTVAAVQAYFHRFTQRWPSVFDLAAAPDAEVMAAWAGLGYYARARNLLKCARDIVQNHGGAFPPSRDQLLRLPGIGPYTAAAIAAICWDEPVTVVDGNVERVIARVFAVHTPLPAAKPELNAQAARLTPQQRPGDYAQAMMDLGATLCTPRSPACGLCPVASYCEAQAEGVAAQLPRRTPRESKPIREGIAYVARRADGALLLERRPESGLLGGMLGWPTSEWGLGLQEAPPVLVSWRRLEAQVRHTFTHFHLRLYIDLADVAQDVQPARGTFVAPDAFTPTALPTVMRKVWALAAPQIRL
jgi:A/G-specific adenine glycosylase